jgi:hypothetical protein
MKKTALLILSTFILTYAHSQAINWFPKNAEWYYEGFCMQDEDCGDYAYYAVNGPVEIGGHNATEIALSYQQNDELTIDSLNYLRLSGDTVYRYYPAADVWHQLYNFNTPVGETWTVQGDTYVGYGEEADNDLFEVRLDSTNTEIIAGQERRVLYTSAAQNSLFAFQGKIVEGIGPVQNSWGLLGDPESFIAIGWPPEFSCYLENSALMYGSNSGVCQVLSIENVQAIEFLIFPNPSAEAAQLTLANQTTGQLYIYNLRGQRVKSQKLNSLSTRITTTGLTAGVYFVQVITENGRAVKKLAVASAS